MFKSKLFVRFALLGVLISAVMLIVSIYTTQWMRDLIFDEPFKDRGPFRIVERIIENKPPSERVAALRELQSKPIEAFAPHGGHGGPPHDMPPMGPPPGASPGEGGPNPFFDFILLDSNGTILYPSTPLSDQKLKDVQEAFTALRDNPRQVDAGNDRLFMRRLLGAPTQYLARGTHFRPPAPPFKHFVFLMSIQLLAILIAVFLTLGAVLFSIRQRALEAEQVIRDLTAGNLKARIPITKMDEVGQVMFSFNKMADEIEHLIEHLRKTEHARRDLLRELAHDLRTPVASLKSLIETVAERADVLPKDKLKELLDLAMSEAVYFEGLVDDLLFIGRVQEPKYKINPEKFDVRDLVRLEIETSAHRHDDKQVILEAAGEVWFDGDESLIKRLVRNGIENAASFARSRVTVSVSADARGIEIKISDDGPGFDTASLASFGQRKYSRQIIDGPTKRISLGLGSVIMKSIVDAYRGDLRVSNRIDEQTRDVLGADVVIRLPVV